MKGKNQDKNYIYDENYNNNMEVENMESEIKKIIELGGENMKVEKRGSNSRKNTSWTDSKVSKATTTFSKPSNT